MMEMHPAPNDPGYAAHVEQLSIMIGLDVEEVEAELAHVRRMQEAQAAHEAAMRDYE